MHKRKKQVKKPKKKKENPKTSEMQTTGLCEVAPHTVSHTLYLSHG